MDKAKHEIQTLIYNLRVDFNKKLDDLQYLIESMQEAQNNNAVLGDMVHLIYNDSHYFGDIVNIDDFTVELSLLKPFTTIIDENGECLYLWKLESGVQNFYRRDIQIVKSVPALGDRRYTAVCDLGFSIHELDVNASDMGLEYYADNVFFVKNE